MIVDKLLLSRNSCSASAPKSHPVPRLEGKKSVIVNDGSDQTIPQYNGSSKSEIGLVICSSWLRE